MIRRNPDALAIGFILLMAAFFGAARNVAQSVRWNIDPIHRELMTERDKLKFEGEQLRSEGEKFRLEGEKFRSQRQHVRDELKRAFRIRSI